MRIAMGLGMHRSASRHNALSAVERESRRRTWWVLYFFDRFSASKIGQPLSVRDEDIDVEMPSMNGLTPDEMAEFLDPRNLIINIKLARIIGNICKLICFVQVFFEVCDLHASASDSDLRHSKGHRRTLHSPGAQYPQPTSCVARRAATRYARCRAEYPSASRKPTPSLQPVYHSDHTPGSSPPVQIAVPTRHQISK
jgi:hypothetical protein